jgi:hypothetical protein
MKVDAEKPLLVNVGVKVAPDRVVSLQAEARTRGMSVSELVRWIVDQHFEVGVIREQMKVALKEFFASNPPLVKQ